MANRSSGSKDFMSEWRLDPTAQDDELRVAKVQYNSVARVAKWRDARACQRDGSSRLDECNDGVGVTEDLGGGDYSDEEEAILRRRKAPQSARARAHSASAIRPLSARLQGDPPRPNHVQRPLSASGSRPTRGPLSPTQKAHDLAWMPAKIKASKWTEMLQSGPQFQERNLRLLEAETYALLQEVLGQPSRGQSRRGHEIGRAEEVKQKGTVQGPTSRDCGKAKVVVAVGSGLQVARTNKKARGKNAPKSKTDRSDSVETAQRRSFVEKTKARTKSVSRLSKSNSFGRVADAQMQKRQQEAQARAKVMQEMGWLEDIGLRKASLTAASRAEKDMKNKKQAIMEKKVLSVSMTEDPHDTMLLDQELTLLQSLRWREDGNMATSSASRVSSEHAQTGCCTSKDAMLNKTRDSSGTSNNNANAGATLEVRNPLRQQMKAKEARDEMQWTPNQDARLSPAIHGSNVKGEVKATDHVMRSEVRGSPRVELVSFATRGRIVAPSSVDSVSTESIGELPSSGGYDLSLDDEMNGEQARQDVPESLNRCDQEESSLPRDSSYSPPVKLHLANEIVAAAELIQRQYRGFVSRRFTIEQARFLDRKEKSSSDHDVVHQDRTTHRGHTQPACDSLVRLVRGDAPRESYLDDSVCSQTAMGDCFRAGTDRRMRMNQDDLPMPQGPAKAWIGLSDSLSAMEDTDGGLLEESTVTQSTRRIGIECKTHSAESESDLRMTTTDPCEGEEVDNSVWRHGEWRRGQGDVTCRNQTSIPGSTSTRRHQEETTVCVEDAGASAGGGCELPRTDHGSSDGHDERIVLHSDRTCDTIAQNDGSDYGALTRPSPREDATTSRARVAFVASDVVELGHRVEETGQVLTSSGPRDVDAESPGRKPPRATHDDTTRLLWHSWLSGPEQEDIRSEVCVGSDPVPETTKASPGFPVGPNPREEECVAPLLHHGSEGVHGHGEDAHDAAAMSPASLCDGEDLDGGRAIAENLCSQSPSTNGQVGSLIAGHAVPRDLLALIKSVEAANCIGLCWIRHGWRAKRLARLPADKADATETFDSLLHHRVQASGQIEADPWAHDEPGDLFALPPEDLDHEQKFYEAVSSGSLASGEGREAAIISSVHFNHTDEPPCIGVASASELSVAESKGDTDNLLAGLLVAAAPKSCGGDGCSADSPWSERSMQACAVRRIQQQYRVHVSRRNLLDQLAFLVRRHRRESRKKTRRLSLASHLACHSAALTDHLNTDISQLVCESSSPSHMAATSVGVARTIDESLIFVACLLDAGRQEIEGEASSSPAGDGGGGDVSSPLSCGDALVPASTTDGDGLLVETVVCVDRTKPDDAMGSDAVGEIKTMWERYMDKDANKSFYYNPTRRVSQWDRPVDDEVVDRTAEQEAPVEDRPLGAEASTAMPAETAVGATPTERWERYTDGDTNKSFYFNTERQISQWTRPYDGAVVDTTAASTTQLESSQRTKHQATLLESYGGWDRFLSEDSATIFYHHAERSVEAQRTPREFSEVRDRLLSPASDASGDRWMLRRNRSLKGDRRGEWQAFVDTETHQPFYYNTQTGESCWEKPAAFLSDAHASSFQWVMYVDAATSQPYYVNVLTSATSWTKPADFDAAVTSDNVARLAGIIEPSAAEEGEQEDYVISIHDEQDAAAWLAS